MTETPQNPPPGFYPDQNGVQRYWDGTAWTDQTQQAAAATPVAPQLPNRQKGERPWFKKKRFIIPGVVVALFLIGGIAGGSEGGSTVTMPDVVGMRLDEAHRQLEDLGLEDFEDTDVIGKEDTILRDKNWIVVAQDPAAGATKVDAGTKPKLSVGNQDDKSVLKRIPVDSPFAIEAATEAADKKKDEKDSAAKAAADKKSAAKKTASAARSYAKKIDEAFGARMPQLVKLYVKNADHVQAEGGGPVVAAQNAIAARDAFDQLLSLLGSRDIAPPDSLDKVKKLDGVEDRLRDAVAGFVVASEDLIKAIDTQAPSALANELSDRAYAIRDWNQAMRDIYGAADMKPPLIPGE